LLNVMREDAPIARLRDATLDALDVAKPLPEAATPKTEPTPKPKRVRRQKVSAPTKGCVPVSLGGRGLPTSILSRREYGLRSLRR
jgi:hypothetical protein